MGHLNFVAMLKANLSLLCVGAKERKSPASTRAFANDLHHVNVY